MAWGCTSRNGGQAQNASGRLTRSQWIKRWGVDDGQRMHAEIVEGFETSRELIGSGEIDCDPQDGRALLHRPQAQRRDGEAGKVRCKVLKEVFGYPTEILDAASCRQDYVNGPGGRGRHARARRHRRASRGKLAYGYLGWRASWAPRSTRAARSRAGRARRRPPPAHARRHGAGTDGGIATGGYTPPGLIRPRQAFYADPVQLARHPADDDGGEGCLQLQGHRRGDHRYAHAATLLPKVCPTTGYRSAAEAPSPVRMPPTRATCSS